MRATGGILGVFFALFWSAFVIFFDTKIGGSMIHQFQTRDYAEAEGSVLRSEIVVNHGKSTTYSAKITYRYKAEGAFHTSTRRRYDTVSSSGLRTANAMVANNPPGSAVKVFYNPKNPADSVLETGINGGSLLLLMFITPFNMIMLGILSVNITALRNRIMKPVAGGASIRREAMRTRLRVPGISPIFAGGIALLTLSFASIFVVGISTNMHPSISVAEGTWAVVLVAAFGVALRRWLKIQSGNEDIVIDEGAQTISLPLTCGRKSRETLAFSSIGGIDVENVAHRGSKGGTWFSYAPKLRLREQTGSNTKLGDWSDETCAQSFAAWLRQRMGLPQ